MSETGSKREAPKTAKIDLSDEGSVRYWTARLGITHARLIAAVKAAGTSPMGVETYLKMGWL